MKKHPKLTRLQMKFFRYYLSISVIIILVFSSIFYMFASRNLLSSQIATLESINHSFQTQVDDAIRNLDLTSININYSSMSKETLDKYFNLVITASTRKDLAELFIAMSGTELKADQINLYDYSGNVLQVGLSTLTKEADEQSLYWVEKTKELGGSKILTSPYGTSAYSKSVKNEQWFISLFRSFNNQYGRSVGAIETVKQCKSIFKSIITYQKKNKEASASVYIFDESGELIYPYNVSEENQQLWSQYFKTDSFDPEISFKSPVDSRREYAARTTSKYTGYTYMTVMPEDVILAPVYNMMKILGIIVTLLFLIILFVCSRLSVSIVKPIKHLKHIIQRMELDTLGQEEVTNYPISVDELDELYQAFQNMNDKLKDSMSQLMESREQEIKSRSLALQTQINPHFYYNTLSSIMVLAENGENEEVVTLCQNLSRIMRYITDTTNSIVTLKEELDYVRKYLYCMKVRYQSSLNYSIEVDDTLLSLQVPKLIIQPIVENAIKYGSNCEPPWHIRISSEQTDTYWKILVTDSGNGFTEEAMEKISSNIQKALADPGMPELQINGLGTLNVYLRWRLFAKDQIIFEYGNTEDGHGRVSVGRRLL